jgi:hypothetical protein
VGLTSASGFTGLAGNAVVGGATAVTNTQFNNVQYGEETKLYEAGGLGAGFGAVGAAAGAAIKHVVTAVVSNIPRIPMVGVVGPISAQGSLNPLPSQIGNTVSNTIGTIPAFIPLDNGLHTSITIMEVKK